MDEYVKNETVEIINQEQKQDEKITINIKIVQDSIEVFAEALGDLTDIKKEEQEKKELQEAMTKDINTPKNTSK